MSSQITIYTSPTCGYCLQAKQLLESAGIAYTEIDVFAQPGKRDEIVAKTGHMTLPIIMNGEELIGGYDELKALHTDGGLTDL